MSGIRDGDRMSAEEFLARVDPDGLAELEQDKPKAKRQHPERDFQSWIVYKVAQPLGWLHFHDYRSDKSTPGWPDLVLVRGGRLIFAELKAKPGLKPSHYQKIWMESLQETCAEVYLWDPTMEGEIVEVLLDAEPNERSARNL